MLKRLASFLSSLVSRSWTIQIVGVSQSESVAKLIVVSEGNEDETETADTTDGCGQVDQGHSPGPGNLEVVIR
jgi:hypothetical protein